MANEYYDNSDLGARFQAGTTAVGADVDAKLDSIEAGFDKLPTEAQLKQGKINYAVDTGAANAYVVALPYAPASYADGLEIKFKAVNANTGASTVNVNGLGTKAVQRPSGSALSAGDIPAGSIVTARYNGTAFLLDSAYAASTAAESSEAAAAASAAAALVSENAAAASEAAADADAAATAADRVQTGLDAAATAADRVQTGLDAASTAADAISTAADAVATAADRVQTGLDVISADADAVAAASSASAAATSALEAQSYAKVSARNCALNQDPISQGTATRTGFETLLGTASSGISGATGLLTWKKDRNNVENHYLSSTLFGDFYLSSNTTAGLTATVPAATADDVTWQWRLDESTSGTTNRGQAYSAHYNAYLGCVLISVEGDGLAGHEVPHFMGNMAGRKWSAYIKNADSVGDWTSFSSESNSASGEHLELNTTAALATDATRSLLVSDDTITLGSSSLINGSGNTIWIMLFADVEGVSKIGKYIGTGAAGNYVDCGFKVGFLMVKKLSAAGNWVMVDAARSADNQLYPNLTNAEAVADEFDFNDTGFNVNGTASDTNSSNAEYLFLAFADSGSGSTTYEYPTTDDTLTVNQNTLLSFANGFNSSGEVNTQELVGAGITATLGAGFENKHLWMYKDKAGSYDFSEYRPLEGITRNDADKWGVVSPVDPSLRTTAKHFDYESATGVVSAETETASFEAYHAFGKSFAPVADTDKDWASTAIPAWIQYKGTEKRILKSWRIMSGALSGHPSALVVEGSNDGLNWVAIDSTYSAGGYPDVTEDLWGDIQDTSANTTAYLYHRIDVTAVHSGTIVQLTEIEFNTILPSDYYLVNEGQMYNSSDVAIERAYLAEVRTGGSGDVTYLRNLPVAKAKADSGEFQGDVTVHGEIANRGVCTAWVSFDGTQNPPLILDSYNVADVVDVGTGLYDVFFLSSLVSKAYSASATSGGTTTGTNSNTYISASNSNETKVRVGVINAGALSDSARISVQVFGGKEIK